MLRLSLVGLFSLVLALPAAAQTPGGNVTGSVRDQQGAAVPGSEVTVQGSDATFRFTTNCGRRFPLPRPSTWRLPAHGDTRRDSARPPATVIVAVGKTVDAPLELRVAAVIEIGDRLGGGADPRRHGDGHVHDVFARRAGEDSDVARSVLGAAYGTRRAARSREHRRQRNRPGPDRRLERQPPAGHRLVARRHRHHRHGGGRRCRRRISTSTTSRRSRCRRPARTSAIRPAASASTSSRNGARTSSTATSADTSPTTPSRRPTCRPSCRRR